MAATFPALCAAGRLTMARSSHVVRIVFTAIRLLALSPMGVELPGLITLSPPPQAAIADSIMISRAQRAHKKYFDFRFPRVFVSKTRCFTIFSRFLVLITLTRHYGCLIENVGMRSVRCWAYSRAYFARHFK